jgi:hypothetical protein
MEISEFNEGLDKLERFFNIAGSIPIVGSVSGSIRASLANVQFVTGVVLGVIGLFTRDVSEPKKVQVVHLGVEHIFQSVLNMIRGIGEMIAAATIVGSVFFLVPQLIKNSFAPVYKYGSFSHPKQLNPSPL